MGIGHAENEKSEAGGHHGHHFQGEDPSQLVRTEKGEWDMDEPIAEEGCGVSILSFPCSGFNNLPMNCFVEKPMDSGI
jgi:hypothetical protein